LARKLRRVHTDTTRLHRGEHGAQRAVDLVEHPSNTGRSDALAQP
jgi:hypothetical protein